MLLALSVDHCFLIGVNDCENNTCVTTHTDKCEDFRRNYKCECFGQWDGLRCESSNVLILFFDFLWLVWGSFSFLPQKLSFTTKHWHCSLFIVESHCKFSLTKMKMQYPI